MTNEQRRDLTATVHTAKTVAHKTSSTYSKKKKVACTTAGHKNACICRHKQIQHIEQEPKTNPEDEVSVIIISLDALLHTWN